MTHHKVKIAASKAGSIGTKYGETREYLVRGNDRDEIIDSALRAAQADGLEHIIVTQIDGKKTYKTNT